MNIDAVLGDFTAALAEAGLRADIARQGTLREALNVIPAHGLLAVLLAGRVVLCRSPEELARFDACFARFFFGKEFAPVEILPDPDAPPMLPGANDLRKRDEEEEQDDREVEAGAASPAEILRRRKLSTLAPEEQRQIFAMIARLRGRLALMRGRRRTASSRGRIDVRRTVREAMGHGGDAAVLHHQAARPRIRKRVLLVDVSGSMAAFAPGLLRFAYAAHRAAPQRTEVFTIGTRLTRVSRQFAGRDAEAGILAASQAVPDWSGGTRLGEQLRAFLDLWGQRGMARGAVVVIISDGLERGGAGLLGEQMVRLRRLAHRVIWANPHKSTPGFEPLMAGMQAAMPALHHFVSGSSVNELEMLIKLMGET